jgi:hemolysin activation/secretion protein
VDFGLAIQVEDREAPPEIDEMALLYMQAELKDFRPAFDMAEARYRDEEGLYGGLELVDLARITYCPVVASYSATFQNEKFTTQLNAGVTYNRRPLSDDSVAFDNKRFDASPSFAHLNADLSHTQQLPEGFQLYGKVQGQVADGLLVSSEQLSVGGLDTVRGYLETEGSRRQRHCRQS